MNTPEPGRPASSSPDADPFAHVWAPPSGAPVPPNGPPAGTASPGPGRPDRYAPPGGPAPNWYHHPAPNGPPAGTASPGTRYDRLARTPWHRWWRPPLALAASLAYWFAGVFAVYAAGSAINELTGERPASEEQFVAGSVLNLGAALLILALGIPAVLAAARWPQRRPAGSVISVLNRMRWRWLAVSLGIALIAISAMYTLVVVLTAVTGGTEESDLDLSWVGWGAFLGPALMLLVLAPLQSAGEEFVFRGWIPQFFGAYLRSPILGVLISSLLFASAHGLGTTWGFMDLVLFGILAGFLTVRTGGLEAAIALHVMNNLPSFLLAAAAGQLEIDATAADSPWQLFAVDIVVLPGYAALILMLARRLRIPDRVPEPSAEEAPVPGGSASS